jgi:hypothetical protein
LEVVQTWESTSVLPNLEKLPKTSQTAKTSENLLNSDTAAATLHADEGSLLDSDRRLLSRWKVLMCVRTIRKHFQRGIMITEQGSVSPERHLGDQNPSQMPLNYPKFPKSIQIPQILQNHFNFLLLSLVLKDYFSISRFT